MRRTHAALDAPTEAVLHLSYERTIELGAHPNERSVFAAPAHTDSGFGAVYLANNPAVIAMALKTAVEAAVGALKTFRLIFPERFAIVEMDSEVARFVEHISVFALVPEVEMAKLAV